MTRARYSQVSLDSTSFYHGVSRGTQELGVRCTELIARLCVMKKLIALFAIAAVLVVVAGQVDDELSDTARNLIDRVEAIGDTHELSAPACLR